jgi:four helix bundle protein
MAKVERFEDLIAWQKGRLLIREIYAVSERRPFSRDFAMRDQIRSAALSITSNIAEGFERAVHGDFQRFLVYAKASCAEVRSLLYSALDVGHIDERIFSPLMEQAQEVGRIIGGLRSSIERRRNTQHSALSTQHS